MISTIRETVLKSWVALKTLDISNWHILWMLDGAVYCILELGKNTEFMNDKIGISSYFNIACTVEKAFDILLTKASNTKGA